MMFEISVLTHVGSVRSTNQDALAIDGDLIAKPMFGPIRITGSGERLVILLADGMGGHSNGSMAGKMALSSLIASSRKASSRADWLDAIHEANDAIYDLMDHVPTSRGMGSTIVGAVCDGTSVLHFNVGDSRAYIYASGSLVRLSHDDVPSVPAGIGSRRRTHRITQSLGGLMGRTRISPHMGRVESREMSDVVLLCSDGLTDMVDEMNIEACMGSTMDIQVCASRLLQAALDNGGEDNISIILARRTTA